MPAEPPQEPQPSDLAAFVGSLRQVVDGARLPGIRVGLEPIINHLVSTTGQAAAVLAQVDGLG